MQLNSEKEKLVNENEALKLQMKRMTQGLDNASLDKEKIKVSILHSLFLLKLCNLFCVILTLKGLTATSQSTTTSSTSITSSSQRIRVNLRKISSFSLKLYTFLLKE